MTLLSVFNFYIVFRMCVCRAGEGGGPVAGEERRGPAVPHQEEPRGPHPQTHADIQGEQEEAVHHFENI